MNSAIIYNAEEYYLKLKTLKVQYKMKKSDTTTIIFWFIFGDWVMY